MDYTYIIRIIQLIIMMLVPEHRSPIFPFDDLLGLLVRYSFGRTEPGTAIGNATQNSISVLAPTEGIVETFGYPIEVHQIVSKDGYVLTLHRIPQKGHYRSTKKPTARKLPFVLVPGLLGDSAYYVIKRTGAGCVFSDAEHDVWLVNNRGTRYSRKHTKLNPDIDKKYWDFSFHEMGADDMPFIVDYILSKSKATELYLVGHSMGGAIVSIFLVENPSYSQNVKAIFLLSPALNVTHTNFPLAQSDQTTINKIMKIIFNDMELPTASITTTDFALHHCSDPFGNIVCQQIAKLFGETGIDDSGEPIYYILSLCSTGSSIKTFRHFMQTISSGTFSYYDYGIKDNLKKYGQEKPSDYDLNSIKVPTYVFYSLGDTFVWATDLLAISDQLGNLVKMICITRHDAKKPFTHYDYIIANEAKQLVYERILTETATLELQPYQHPQRSVIADKIEEQQPQLQR